MSRSSSKDLLNCSVRKSKAPLKHRCDPGLGVKEQFWVSGTQNDQGDVRQVYITGFHKVSG